MKKNHIEELQTMFGKERVLTEPEDMIAYSYDASHVEMLADSLRAAGTV